MQLDMSKEMEKRAAEGLAMREVAHKGRPFLFFDNNVQRLEAIKSWYPLVYDKLLKKYPCFCERPDDYPIAVVSSVNRELRQLIPYGSFRELSFSVSHRR